MKSKDSNRNQAVQLINLVLDKIFILPIGHEEVSTLLKREFSKKYKTQLEQIDLTDPASLIKQLTDLANEFLSEIKNNQNILTNIQQIYTDAIATEVATIARTDKGFISRSIANKKTYETKTSNSPVKSFIALEYNKLNGTPKAENYIATLKEAFGDIRLGGHFKTIFKQELKFISETLAKKDKIIVELSNHAIKIVKQQAFDSKFDTKLQGLGEKPFFVINTPMYVPVDEQNLADSSDEEPDSEYSLDDFKAPPYYIKSGENEKIKSGPAGLAERGTLLENNLQKTQSSHSLAESLYVDPFLKKIQFEGWAEEFTGNAFVVIGLNRSRSLSTARNQALHDEFNRATTSDFPSEVMGFFWDRTWYKNENSNEIKVTYAEARKFYKQLKRINRKSAETFRKQNEGNGHIPYQDIRERLKESAEAARIVRMIREKSPDTHIYLSLTDSDTKHFNGIYTEYENFIAKNKYPHVMSTGYEFSDDPKDYNDLPKDLIAKLEYLNLASKIDRAIRIETAKLNPTGVYYPEPNTCILIPKKPKPYDKLPYTFLDYSEIDAKIESAVALRKLVASGKTRFAFIDGRPLITALPARSYKRSVSKVNFQFSEYLTSTTGYTPADLKNLAEITQSHFYYNLWARNLEKNNPESVANGNIKHGILCDLFNFFKATILEEKDSFTTDKKNITKKIIIETLRNNYSEEECAILYQAAKKSMLRVKRILGNRAEYIAGNPSYQPFAKGKYVSAVITARKSDTHIDTLDLKMQALEIDDTKPRVIDGYNLQDVAGDGNCFYHAVFDQLKKVAPNLLTMPKGTEAHTWLRWIVEGNNFSDRRWASDQDIFVLTQKLGIAIDVIDTRKPQDGFATYYKQAGTELDQTAKIIKLAFTGDHFMSVTSTPQENLGFAARVSSGRESPVQPGIRK
jgi:hypothetical protein